MRERIEAIMKYKERALLSRIVSVALLLVLAFTAIACASSRTPGTRSAQGSQDMQGMQHTQTSQNRPVLPTSQNSPGSQDSQDSQDSQNSPDLQDSPGSQKLIGTTEESFTINNCTVTTDGGFDFVWMDNGELAFKVDKKKGSVIALKSGVTVFMVSSDDESLDFLVRTSYSGLPDNASAGEYANVLDLIIMNRLLKCSYLGPVSTITCGVGDTFTPKAILLLSTEQPGPELVWESSDESVFTVDRSTGRIIVSGRGEATCKVTVGELYVYFIIVAV